MCCLLAQRYRCNPNPLPQNSDLVSTHFMHTPVDKNFPERNRNQDEFVYCAMPHTLPVFQDSGSNGSKHWCKSKKKKLKYIQYRMCEANVAKLTKTRM